MIFLFLVEVSLKTHSFAYLKPIFTFYFSCLKKNSLFRSSKTKSSGSISVSFLVALPFFLCVCVNWTRQTFIVAAEQYPFVGPPTENYKKVSSLLSHKHNKTFLFKNNPNSLPYASCSELLLPRLRSLLCQQPLTPPLPSDRNRGRPRAQDRAHLRGGGAQNRQREARRAQKGNAVCHRGVREHSSHR